jgi:hypothetical protein
MPIANAKLDGGGGKLGNEAGRTPFVCKFFHLYPYEKAATSGATPSVL